MWILLLCYQVFAQDVLIQAHSASKIDYEQHLNTNPIQTSYSHWLMNKKNPKKILLTEKLKKAQYHFIDGSIDKSKKIFQSIAEMKWQHNWKIEQRKIIHFSLLRIAQMEKQQKTKEKYIVSSIHFDRDLEPDNQVFPPPFIALFHKLKNNQNEKIWPLPSQSTEFEQILINGKMIPNGRSFVKTSSSTKRIHFISNKYQDVVMTIDPKNLEASKLIPTPLATGSCESPQIDNLPHSKKMKVFFTSKCLLPVDSSFKKLVQIKKAQEQKPKNNLFKSKKTWLWIGLAVLTSAVAIKSLDQKNDGRQQTPESRDSNHISNTPASRN